MAPLTFLTTSLTLLLCIWTQSNAQYQNFVSPCPRLFVYEGKSPEPDRWYGILTLLSDTDLSGVWLRLIFDRPSLQLGNWFGQVGTTDNVEYLIKNRQANLKANTPQPLRFFIKYDRSQPPPRLVSFRLNAVTMCPEGAATENPAVTMELQTSGPGSVATARPPRPPPPPSPPDDELPFPGDYQIASNPNLNPFQELDAICGTVIRHSRTKREMYPYQYPYSYPHYLNSHWNYDYYEHDPYIRETVGIFPRARNNRVETKSFQAQPRPLITSGQETREGEYPWHAALYHAKGIDLAYICGASLVSKLHVITVAHCVTRRRSKVPLNSDNLVVYLGKYYLRRFSSPGIQDRQVSDIIPHPQYDAQSYSNDIALVKFRTPADITDYVRPVCLWQAAPDLTPILDKLGSVVGWGFDETGKVTEELMQAKMPVVSQETCLFSFPDFYSRFTSSNTYCAGFRNGTSVCNGDSGGGMVFPKPNSNPNHPRWQLRGLVSISVALQNQFKCDTSHYVVFTDSAKYLDWIRKTMQQ